MRDPVSRVSSKINFMNFYDGLSVTFGHDEAPGLNTGGLIVIMPLTWENSP